jgi:hypothetical protein
MVVFHLNYVDVDVADLFTCFLEFDITVIALLSLFWSSLTCGTNMGPVVPVLPHRQLWKVYQKALGRKKQEGLASRNRLGSVCIGML